MRAAAALVLGLLAAAGPAAAAERRCGWYANPTPGNHWITDRDAEWTITEQGRATPPGMDRVPDLTTRDWVRTNGNYGYGCVCLTVETDRAASRVTAILAAAQLPLRRCREDRALRAPGG